MNTQKPSVLRGIRILLGYYRAHLPLIILDLSAVIIHAGVQIFIPAIALKVFEVYLPQGDLRATAWAALAFALLTIFASALDWVKILAGNLLGIRVEAAMRTDFFDHIQRLPFAFFDRTKTGEVLSRITSDLSLVKQTAHQLPEDIAESILMLGGAIIVMFWINPSLALFTCLPMPFILLFACAFQKKIANVWRENRRNVSALSAHVENVVQGIREIKSFTREQKERNIFRRVNRNFRVSYENVYRLYAPLFAGTKFLLDCYSLLYIAAGAWMVARGNASIQQLFVFFMYSRYIIVPMCRIIYGLDSYQRGFVGYTRFREFVDAAPETDCAAGEKPPEHVNGHLHLTGLRFAYPETDRIVLDIPELDIPAGTQCAFVGPSGGGKSTFAALIPRFYEPTEGTITLDGRDTATIPKRALREAIGIVAQRPFLFDGTIRDNLLLGKSDATDSELFHALKQANLDDFARSLPKGLETPVGEHGLMLSGGQAQRIAIARVFLKNPPILILDEATSALDTFAEAAVQEALMRLSHGRTTIVIAHRLTTIRHATMICYLENGNIVERGTHKELNAAGGHYHKLLEAAGMLRNT